MSDPATYTVGWICAITTENIAARQFLDEEHDPPKHVSKNDNNTYTLGRIGSHRVVIAVLPDGEYGTTTAATVATNMIQSFPNVRIGLMVGIGGGAPSKKNDIRLGDVVVCSPRDGRGGVLRYDYGKAIQGHDFQQSGFLNQPQTLLRTAVADLRGRYLSDGNQIHQKIEAILVNKKRLKTLGFQRPDVGTDNLFLSSSTHANDDQSCDPTCFGNGDDNLVNRRDRTEDDDSPEIHYGLIALADKLMKDAEFSDALAESHGVLCFEMEAAGLMNHFPCLVVRGICDYSDTHKNKSWQGYAAMAAAAYAKDLLGRIAPQRIEAEERLSDVLSSTEVEKLGEKFEKANKDAQDTREAHQHDRVLSWLSAPDPSTNYHKALRQRQPGSGQWFLRCEVYSQWKTTPNSLLWLHGIPGCGKTILAATIVEDLEKDDAISRPLYFYFDFADSRKQSLEDAVRSLISQLYLQTKDVRGHVESLHNQNQNGGIQPSIESSCRTFQHMIKQVGEVWIVLDALDECKKRMEYPDGGLLPWIECLQELQEVNVHLLVTSRPEQDIQSFIDRRARSEDIIDIQSNLIANDISAYIHERVRQHVGLTRWREEPEIQDEIEAALRQKADGMFRWVSCQLDEIKKCIDVRALRQTLQSLPKTLEETYARILDQIPHTRKPSAILILQLLLFAERPFQVCEVIDAIAVDIDQKPRFDPKHALPVPQEITTYCSSLVTLAPTPPIWYGNTVEGYFPRHSKEPENERERTLCSALQLAHFSVKEYLISNRSDQEIFRQFEETVANAAIAEVCIAYQLAVIEDLPTTVLLQDREWGQYASSFCFHHLRNARNSSGATTALAFEMLTSEIYTITEPVSPLFTASSNGLTKLVEMLLKHGADANFQEKSLSAAAEALSFRGLDMKYISHLQQGEPGCHLNALCAASSYRHWECVELLLDNGAKFKTVPGDWFFYTFAASGRKGNTRACELYFNRCVGPSALAELLHPGFRAVASEERIDIVRFRLAKGFNVNAKWKDNTVLGHALKFEDVELLRLLLENEADVNAESGTCNVLHHALELENEELVQLLLRNGANIYAKPGGCSALNHALKYEVYGSWVWQLTRWTKTKVASEGRIQMIKVLIDNGAEISDEWEGRHTIFHAMKYENKELLPLFLSGIGINASITDYGTTLQEAIWAGYTHAAHILLENGADVKANSGKWGTALLAACSHSELELVKKLIKRGADVDIRSGWPKRTALQVATWRDDQIETLGDVVPNSTQSGRWRRRNIRTKWCWQHSIQRVVERVQDLSVANCSFHRLTV